MTTFCEHYKKSWFFLLKKKKKNRPSYLWFFSPPIQLDESAILNRSFKTH